MRHVRARAAFVCPPCIIELPERREPLATTGILGVVAAMAFGGCVEGGDREAARMPTTADTVRAELVFAIGETEGDPEYLFGDITSVVAGRVGRVYVADRIGSTIRVYDPDGRYLAQVGQEGQGPGEFQWPADLVFAPDGRLFVRDASRITVLGPRSAGGIADSVVATRRLPDYGNLASTRSRADSAGRYLYPHYQVHDWELMGHSYLIFRDGDALPDTLKVPAYAGLRRTLPAMYRTGPSGGRLVHGLSAAPFSPVPAWDVTPAGTVLGGDGASYALYETDLAGDTVRTIRGPDPTPRPVPSTERADSARALEARLDSLPVPLERIENMDDAVRGDLPETLPAFLAVHVAVDGWIWVERWPGEDEPDTRRYDVFDPAGEFRGVVVLPAPLVRDPPPYMTGDAVYGVLRDAGTDVEQVVKMAFERPD